MRLFIGIALPEAFRKAVAQEAEKLKKDIPGRYVPKENYHITMAFIGEMDQPGAEAANRAMAAAVQGQSPVDLALGRPNYFGKKENAILHMTVDGWRNLWDLDHRLRDALTAEGLSYDEKLFKAHITLARKAKIETEILKNWKVPECTFQVTELTLFHSIRINDVLTYVPIGSVHFAWGDVL